MCELHARLGSHPTRPSSLTRNLKVLWASFPRWTSAGASSDGRQPFSPSTFRWRWSRWCAVDSPPFNPPSTSSLLAPRPPASLSPMAKEARGRWLHPLSQVSHSSRNSATVRHLIIINSWDKDTGQNDMFDWSITDFSFSCSDPLLIYEKAQLGEEGFEGALELFPADFNPKRLQPEFSGKMLVLDYLLAVTRSTTDDKVCMYLYM